MSRCPQPGRLAREAELEDLLASSSVQSSRFPSKLLEGPTGGGKSRSQDGRPLRCYLLLRVTRLSPSANMAGLCDRWHLYGAHLLRTVQEKKRPVCGCLTSGLHARWPPPAGSAAAGRVFVVNRSRRPQAVKASPRCAFAGQERPAIVADRPKGRRSATPRIVAA